MPLVYRAVVADGDGSIAHRVDSVSVAWLHAQGLVDSDFRLSSAMSGPLPTSDHPAWLQCQTAESNRGTSRLHRIRLVEENSDGRWTTTTTWTTSAVGQLPEQGMSSASRHGRAVDLRPSGGDWVWVDLEHEPFGGRPVRAVSPRIVRDLVAVGEAHDGGMPLTADALVVTTAHIKELLGYLRAPARQSPILVFAHDPAAGYGQASLADALAGDLAGVAAVFRTSDVHASQALAAALPEGFGIPDGALRTYLPQAASPGDLATRHRLLRRASIASLGERALPAVQDQVLHLSTQRSGPLDALTVRRLLSGAGAGDGEWSDAQPVESVIPWLRRQITRIRAAVGGASSDLDHLTALPSAQESLAQEIDGLLASRRDGSVVTAGAAESAALRADLSESEADRAVLNQLLVEAAEEIRIAESARRESSDAADYLQLELAEATRADEAASRRIRWLEARVRSLDASGQVAGEVVEVPHSVVEVLQLAGERLVNVAIGPTEAAAAELDIHPGAELFAIKVWNALNALDDYAGAVRAGQHVGNFVLWCQAPPASRSAVSANAVSLVESETVDNHPTLRDKRTFPVPEQVARGGQVYMPAHIRIVRRGTPAPRLHFFDDTRGASGVVLVGYVGQHLPTAQFR